MPILRVKNFEPIGKNRQDDSDGFFTVRIAPVTVFIGETASGKSATAKLCSIFSWLENKLVQTELPLNLSIDVFKSLCRQQEIEDYFLPDTVLMYEGDPLVLCIMKRIKTLLIGIIKCFMKNYQLTIQIIFFTFYGKVICSTGKKSTTPQAITLQQRALKIFKLIVIQEKNFSRKKFKISK